MYACPFSYVGGKSKLLPILVPLFSADSDKVFVDLFGGGFSVGLNVANKSVLYNEINEDLVSLIRLIKETPFDTLEAKILNLIDQYKLSKTNKDGYLKLRVDFNKTRDPMLFCLLIFYSFNHQIRYNSHLQFNTPFGANRSSYNPRTQKNLRNFSEIIHKKDITFSSLDFQKVQIPDEAVVYVDPPYLITTGSYNDGNRGVSRWDETYERELYKYLDTLHERGIPFVLSNMLIKGNNTNALLNNWKDTYNVFSVTTKYKNYQRSDDVSKEIIVTNMPYKRKKRD